MCLWLHGSRLRLQRFHSHVFVVFTKKKQSLFSPQKKVPEPMSHVALSPPFGLTRTAHLRVYPCALCTQNQQVYHLALEEGSSPFRTHSFPQPTLEAAPPSPEASITVSFSPRISVHAVCVSVYFFKHKKCSKCTHTHTYSHTPNI